MEEPIIEQESISFINASLCKEAKQKNTIQ
jgi:hypothetical protein